MLFLGISNEDTEMPQTVHAARIVDRGDVFYFASLDGQDWIEVTADPRASTAEQIDAVMNPKGGTLPLRATRGFIHRHGAVFLDGEQHA